jgi:hypothetical protein
MTEGSSISIIGFPRARFERCKLREFLNGEQFLIRPEDARAAKIYRPDSDL